jgi:hypothetical protein
MDKSARVLTRGWLDMIIGAVVLAGALVALGFPVFLGTYDRWGIQIKCGNGYSSQLVQATADDQDRARQSAPATSYVDQCKSALLHRRVWTLPVAAAGALILIPELAAWARGGSPSRDEQTHEWPAEPTDLHEAALLDRRHRSHWPRPPDTTL